MNRVASRSTIALLLAVILLGGLCVFLAQFMIQADDWAVFQGNPHVYNGVNIGCGVITDRSGEVLLSAASSA